MLIRDIRIGTLVTKKYENDKIYKVIAINEDETIKCLPYDEEHPHSKDGEPVTFHSIFASALPYRNYGGQILKTSFIEETYQSDEEKGQVTCTIKFRINLDQFEKQGFIFNNNYIKKVLGKHLEIEEQPIKTIEKYEYKNIVNIEDLSKLPEKGEIDTLYLTNNSAFYWYGGKYDTLLSGKYLKNNDSIDESAFYRNSTYIKYVYYYGNYSVTSTAYKHKNDKFNLEKGKSIAKAKAKRKIYSLQMGLINDLLKDYKRICNDLESYSRFIKNEYMVENDYLNRENDRLF